MLKGIVLGLIVGIALVVAGAYLYFSSGQVPVAASSPAMPFERKLAGMALHKYLDKLPHPNPAVPEDEKNFIEGAKVYKENCAVCHGLPGEPRTAIADGMFPKPPQLFHGIGVTDDEAWETYWKVANGIRLTGMPGFKGRLEETRMWQVSVLVKAADKLPASVKAELASGAPAGATTTLPAKAGEEEHEHEHVH